LKLKLLEIIFKNSVRTSKRTQPVTITKINWLKLFKETIPVYTDNHAKPTKTKCREMIVKAAATGRYHSA
jgi:hypothetical protein